MKASFPWSELCRSTKFSGMWVALDNCRYDVATKKPLEGDVVDADEDVGALCGRMREMGRGNCAILFCDEDVLVEPRPSQIPAPASAPTLRRRA